MEISSRLIEGELLSYLEEHGSASLRELTRELRWPVRMLWEAVETLSLRHRVRAGKFGGETIIELADNSLYAMNEEATPEVWGG